MRLIKWNVEGYKSISDRHSVEVDELNILIGKNNTGKSSIINSLLDYRDAFPNGEGVSSNWATQRVTGKDDSRKMHYRFEFEFTDQEREYILEQISETGAISQRDISRHMEKGDFDRIRHSLTVHPTGYEGRLHSVFAVHLTVDSIESRDKTWVPLRMSDHESEPQYLNFHQLPNIRYSGRDREFLNIKNFMEDRMSRWRAVDAFRRPDNEQPVERTEKLEPDGRNLSNVLLTLRGLSDDRFESISREYCELMSGVSGVRATLSGVSDTTAVVDERYYDVGFELRDLSAGSKEVLTLVTQIILSKQDTEMLLIEEPELHLHPGAEEKLYNLIKRELTGEESPQIFISTHSSVFVNKSDVGSIIRIRREGHTSVEGIDEEEVRSELRELGYEYSGMLQADAVVFVEGQSDKSVLRTIARRYDFDLDEQNISVIDLDNWSNMLSHARSLVKLLSEFDIPYLFIADSDGDPPDHLRGELMDEVNRTDTQNRSEENGEDVEKDRIWWERIEREDIIIWSETDIEGFLLCDTEAIARVLSTEEQEVERLLEESEDQDADQRIEYVFSEVYDQIDTTSNAYRKVNDGVKIAEQLDLERLPDEFHEAFQRIAGLVDALDHFREQST